MVQPRKVKFMAKKKLNENMRFRTFLKCNVDREELDKQFLHLHNELFEHYCKDKDGAEQIYTYNSRLFILDIF
jgi:hypothetical protein